MSRSPEAVVGGSGGRRRLKVLIADDCRGTLRAMQLLVRYLGCEVGAATDGRLAVQAVGAGDYDVVLMDVMMPVMDGLEATRRIRQDRPIGSGLWIIGVSADSAPEDRAHGLAAGMDDFLPKPLDIEALIRILDELAMGACAVR